MSLFFPQQRRPSPHYCRVGSHIGVFEACSAFTHVSACMLAGSPKAILDFRGFDGFVTSSDAPMASGGTDPLPGGTYTHWKSPPLHGAQYFDHTGVANLATHKQRTSTELSVGTAVLHPEQEAHRPPLRTLTLN